MGTAKDTRLSWKPVASLAKAQQGLVTRAQLLELGVSPTQIDTRLSAGHLQLVIRGLYRLAGVPETWEQRVWAACLTTGGLASHRTAGWLFGLDGLGRYAPREIEVIVPFTGAAASSLATVHRSRTLDPSHTSKRAGVPRTNLARTIVDLSEVLEPKALDLAFDSALRQQADLRAWVSRVVEGWPRRGRRGIANLTALLAERGAALDSALEVKVRRLIRSAGLPPPQAAVEVVDGGQHVAKLDFAWPTNRPRVALMVHGAKFHANTPRWVRDLEQASELSGLNWRVVQTTADEVERRPERLLLKLRRALGGYDPSVTIGRFVGHE